MIGQKAIAIAFPGFNNLGRMVTPVFVLLDHFLHQFSAFSEKMKKIYPLEIWIFCKLHDRIPFFPALRSLVQRFHLNAFWRITFCENVGKIWNYLVHTQQTYFYKIRLRSFVSVDSPSIFLTINPYRPLLAPIYQNQGSFPHASSLKRSWWPPIFITFLAQVTH